MCDEHVDDGNELERLRQENQQLIIDNESLHKQFDEAVLLSAKLEETVNQNVDLTSQIRQLNEDKEDLKRRLQISLQNNLEKEKTNQEALEKITQDRIIELDSIKNKHINQISEIERQNKILIQQVQDKQQNEYKLGNEIANLKKDLSKIYELSSDYFEIKIESTEELLKHLIKPITTHEVNEEIIEPLPKTEETSKLKLKLKHERERYELTIGQFNNEKKKLIGSYEQQITELNHNINENKNLIKRQETQVGELTRSKDDLLKEITVLKTKFTTFKQSLDADHYDEKLDMTSQLSAVTVKYNAMTESCEKFKKQIAVLIAKQRKTKNKLESIKVLQETTQKKYESLTEEHQIVESRLKQVEEERETQNTDLIELNQRVSTLLSTAKSLKEALTEKTTCYDRLKIAWENISVEYENQSQELQIVIEEKNKLFDSVRKLSEINQALEVQISEHILVINNLQSQIQSYEEKVTQSNEPIDESRLLPLAAWSCPTFPAELQNVVEDIAKNQTISSPTKLRQVLSAVAQWFVSRSKRIESELQEHKDESFFYTNLIDQFNNFMYKVFPELPSENYLQNEDLQQSMFSFVSDLRKSLREAQEAKSVIEHDVLEVLLQLDAGNFQEALEHISTLKANNEQYAASLVSCKKQIKQYKKQQDHITKTSTKEKDQLREETIELKEIIKGLESQIVDEKKQAEEEKQVLEVQIERKSNEVRELKVKIESITQEYEKQNQNLSIRIREEKEAKQEIENNKRELEETINQMKTALQTEAQHREKKREENAKLVMKVAQIKSECKARMKAEIEIIEARYKQHSEQQQREIMELKSLISKMTESKSTYEEKYQQSKVENDDLLLKVQTLEMRFSALQGDSEREKRLIESRTKAKILATETEFRNQLDIMKKKLLDAKRTLMGFVAEQFCSLFNAKDSLDEENFVVFIKNIRNKLSKLMDMEAKLRELLSLGPCQSIEDAVSTLLIKISY